MNWNELYAAWNQGTIAPVYLFHGEEEYVKLSALQRLKSLLLPKGMELLNETRMEGAVPVGRIIEACETLPVFCERRLVILRDWQALLSRKGEGEAAEKGAKDEETATFLRWLENPPAGCVLVVFMTGKLSGTSRLHKALKAFEVLFSQLGDADLNKWIAQSARKRGASISAEACSALVFSAGRDLARLQGEIGKLSAYVGPGGEITPHTIASIVTDTPETTVFKLIDALTTGHYAKAQSMLSALLLEGEDEVYILYMLTRQMRLLCHARELLDKKQGASIPSALSLSPYAARMLTPQAQRTAYSRLREGYQLCVEAEYSVKSGKWSKEEALAYAMLRLNQGFSKQK